MIAQRRGQVPGHDHRTIFEDALLLGEALVKWASVVCVSVLATNNEAAAHRAAYELVRANGIGTWVQQLQALVQALHRSHIKHGTISKDLAKHFSRKLLRSEPDCEPFWRARDLLIDVVDALDVDDFQEAGVKKKSRIDVFSDFSFLRNRTRGHGAKSPAFYERNGVRLRECVDLLVDSCAPEHLPWVFLSADSPTTAVLLSLAGPNPQSQASFSLSGAADRNSLFLSAGPDELIAVSRLIQYDSTKRTFWFPNGVWKDAGLKGEFIDYASGTTRSIHMPEYGGPRPTSPRSHTTATTLQFASGAVHTVPALVEGYIGRRGVEADLKKLLQDKTHRIITLKGEGGVGKTSVAIRVLHDIAYAPEPKFESIAWLSARDVDLIGEGPSARSRDVFDVPSIAKEFCRTFEVEDDRATPEELLVQCLGEDGPLGPTLLVIDNFETLDDPEGVHRFLDEHVIPPSKLLITSRHKTYRGDFALDVSGMEPEEAEKLVMQESRAQLCEPRMTPSVLKKIIEATYSRPYPIKLVVAQFAQSNRGVDEALEHVLNREDLLDALFERSFALLSDVGQYLYQLLGLLGKGCPEVVVKGLITHRKFDFFRALEECTRLSLLRRQDGADSAALLDLISDARNHAKRTLVGSPDEMSIRDDVKSVSSFLRRGEPERVLSDFFARTLNELESLDAGREESLRLLELSERCASGSSSRWLQLAGTIQAQWPETRVRSAYKRAVETDPTHGDAWRAWSDWEGHLGDKVQQVYKGIRAVELGEDDIRFCSHIAGQLLFLLRDPAMKDRFPPHRRDGLVSALRFQLEAHREAGRLNADGLGLLGWLYLSEFSGANPNPEIVRRAKACAEEGLRKDGGHEACEGLYNKCLSTLASMNQ